MSLQTQANTILFNLGLVSRAGVWLRWICHTFSSWCSLHQMTECCPHHHHLFSTVPSSWSTKWNKIVRKYQVILESTKHDISSHYLIDPPLNQQNEYNMEPNLHYLLKPDSSFINARVGHVITLGILQHHAEVSLHLLHAIILSILHLLSGRTEERGH